LEVLVMASKKKVSEKVTAASDKPETTARSGKKRPAAKKNKALNESSFAAEISAAEGLDVILEPAEKPTESMLELAVSEHERIALLAYSYWEERGCQGGSPEEDWHRAAAEVRSRQNSEA
jgi:hypothetical protein